MRPHTNFTRAKTYKQSSSFKLQSLKLNRHNRSASALSTEWPYSLPTFWQLLMTINDKELYTVVKAF